MSTALTTMLPEDIENVLVGGDISKLNPQQRLSYYSKVCESLGLNPLTKPFEYLTLNGKTVLYAKKDATDQLRAIHKISVHIVSREVVDGIYVVTARAIRPDGREDESIGAVPLPAGPVDRANAIMKCETKGKRRATLSICGLGWLDETELETIPEVRETSKQVAERRIAEEQAKTPKQLPPPPTQDGPDTTPEQRQTQRDTEAKEFLDGIASEPKTTTKRKRGSISFEALKDWGKLKKELREFSGDDHLYYAALHARGYEHADEIASKEHATVIWRVLATELNRLKQDHGLREQLEHSMEVIGGALFWGLLSEYGASSIEEAMALESGKVGPLLERLNLAVDARRATV